MTPTAHPLSWPLGRPRTPARARKQAAFGKADHTRSYATKAQLTITDANKRLQAELDRLGARDVILSTNVEPRLDGMPRSDRSPPADPGAALYFKLGGRDTVLACDRWDRVADNITAIAKHIDALRGQDRWGVGTLEQAFAGYQALPAPDGAQAAMGVSPPETWWQVLGIDETATASDINAAWRTLARKAHPDQGGSDAEMARLNAARDEGIRRAGS